MAMACPCDVLMEVGEESLAQAILGTVANEAWRIEDKFSRYQHCNIIYRINHSEGEAVEVDDETNRLFDFADELFDLSEAGTTILVSTHYMDEAERCHGIAILDLGHLVAAGTPAQLAEDIHAQVVVIEADQPRSVAKRLDREDFVHSTAQIGSSLRVMVDRDLGDAEGAIRAVLSRDGLALQRCERVRPNLEDVFVAATQERKAQRDGET